MDAEVELDEIKSDSVKKAFTVHSKPPVRAFSPLAGPAPNTFEDDEAAGLQRNARVDKAIMAGVDYIPPERGYSTRVHKEKLKGNRVRSFSDFDSFALGAHHVEEENQEPYRELKEALTELNLLRFFATLTSQGFGEIETILHTDPIVLTALTGMTDDEAIDLLDQVDQIMKRTVRPEFEDDDLSDPEEIRDLGFDNQELTEDAISAEMKRMASQDDEAAVSSAFDEAMHGVVEKKSCIDRVKAIKDSRFRKLITAALSRGFMLFDIVTDAIILEKLIRQKQVGWSLIIFTSIIAPFIVVWSAGLRFISDQGWKELKAVYTFPFSGIVLLILFDVYLIFEAWILNPLLAIFRGGKVTDITDSSEMHAYLRLKSLSELFLENIPQIGIQSFIVLSGNGSEYGLDNSSIYSAVTSAVLNIAFMGFLLNKEAKDNEQGFLDFAMLTLQGRFGYTPFVDTIANGTTKYVDYMSMNQGALRFNADALRKLNAACNAKHCRLETMLMGDTCCNIEEDIVTFHDTILWQLRDTIVKLGAKFQENVSDDVMMYDGGRIFRKACESGWDGLVRELLDYHKPLINKEKRAEAAKESENLLMSKFYEKDANGEIVRVRIDINEQDPETGQTALMMAARQRNYTPIRLLLKHKLMKVKVDAQDNDGATALIHAVTANTVDDEIIRLLLTLGNADVNISDGSGRTALSHLSDRVDEYAVGAMIVLMHTARKKLDVNIACYEGMTPLMYACKNGNFELVVKFLSRSDVDIKAKDNYGRSAFMLSVIENRKSIVSVFLKQKGNKSVLVNECANERDRFMTPLMYASVWEHRTILRILLRQKEIDVNATDINGRTALMLAARADRPKSLALLLSHTDTDYNRIDKTGQDVWGLADMSEQCRMILDVLYPERFEFAKNQFHLWKTKLYKVWYLRMKTEATDDNIQTSLNATNQNLAKAYKLITGKPLPARYYRGGDKKAFNQKMAKIKWSENADNDAKDTGDMKLDADDDSDEDDAKMSTKMADQKHDEPDYVTTVKRGVVEEDDDENEKKVSKHVKTKSKGKKGKGKGKDDDTGLLGNDEFVDTAKLSQQISLIDKGDDIDHDLIDDLVNDLDDKDEDDKKENIKQVKSAVKKEMDDKKDDDSDEDFGEDLYAPKEKLGTTLYELERDEGRAP